MCSTGTAGATTRWSVPPTASTAPGRVRGRCMSRTASSPGRPRRPITRRWARTGPSTSRAVARAAPRFPGTRTRRPGCGIRMPAACWSRCTGKPGPGSGDPVLAWADIQADPRASASLSAGPRQGRVGAGELGRGHRADRGRARAHHQDLRAGSGCRLLADPGDVDGVVRGRVPVRRADRRGDDVVLRLVRRPAGGLAAGVRRSDRCAGVRGLVGRRRI